MIFSEGNWYKWYYGNSKPFARADGEQFRTTYGPIEGPIKPFKQALLDNARSTVEHYPNEKFDLLFSGGIDSELMLRAYLEIGHPIRVNIFRYENNFNLYDVSYAVVVCEQLGVPYKIIDFNLQKFYENDAVRISEQAQSDRPRALVQLVFLEYLDGLPISGSSDCRWFRPHADYSVKAEWRVEDFEHDVAMDRFAASQDRSAIMQWFKWSPQMVISWFKLDWFKRLVNDEIPGKLGVVSTKIDGYREAYPALLMRAKKTGFESIDHLVQPVEDYLKQKNGGLIYRQTTDRSINEFSIEMTGKTYD
jgi:hypothetical protein